MILAIIIGDMTGGLMINFIGPMILAFLILFASIKYREPREDYRNKLNKLPFKKRLAYSMRAIKQAL